MVRRGRKKEKEGRENKEKRGQEVKKKILNVQVVINRKKNALSQRLIRNELTM